jgi:hypothetical protein
MKKLNLGLIFGLLVLFSGKIVAQNTKRVLFLGNSYTHGNNLPEMISNVAASTGKTLIFDMNAPGGYYINQHLTNPVSLSKIQVGDWDNIVLQDQSLAMAYPGYSMVQLPSSIEIDGIIKANNTCAQTMFFSTWGRKYGDTYLCTPPYCSEDIWINRDFYQMNTDIQTNYKLFADTIRASMSPVGAVWANIKQNYPNIELHETDDSHPTWAGSYAAACCFYAAIFRSDPTQITFNAGLSEIDANHIKLAAKQIVYNNLTNWNIGSYDHLLDSNCLILGIDDLNSSAAYWKINPNPVTDLLSIAFIGSNVTDRIIVCNVLGEVVLETEISGTEVVLDFSQFSSGLYVVKSTTTSRISKVIKK